MFEISFLLHDIRVPSEQACLTEHATFPTVKIHPTPPIQELSRIFCTFVHKSNPSHTSRTPVEKFFRQKIVASASFKSANQFFVMLCQMLWTIRDLGSIKTKSNYVSDCDWVYEDVDCHGGCVLASPGYPGLYPPNIRCRYLITAGFRVSIALNFSSVLLPHK